MGHEALPQVPYRRKPKPRLPGDLRVRGVLGCQAVLEGPVKKEQAWVTTAHGAASWCQYPERGEEGGHGDQVGPHLRNAFFSFFF